MILGICGLAHCVESYWNPDNISELKVEYLKIIQGENIDKLDLMLSSQAAAMKAACPSVN